MIPEVRNRGIGDRMRVVMVGDFPRDQNIIGGGVESVMLYLCEHLALMPHVDLRVVTMERWNRDATTRSFGSFDVTYVAQSPLRGPLKRYFNIQRLASAIRACRPDIVHAHIAGQYSQAAAACGVPWVLTLHGIRYLEANLKTSLKDRLYRRHVIRAEEERGLRNARNIISINPFIEESFGDKIVGDVYSVENPVADKWFDIDEPGDPLGLLYVGRITLRKDILTLLEAFRLFHSRFPDAKLRMAGSADQPDPAGYFDQVRATIEQSGLGNAVELLGNLDEDTLASRYGQSAFFVTAAVLETAPMSIGQALAAGRILVVTDAGGCRHMITNGETGLVVPVRDARAFADALISCAENGQFSSTLRARARVDAEKRYRAGPIAARTAEIYERILRGGARGAKTIDEA
jgi:glycosyltransferase involved in cell wall biosynthesis